MSSVNFRVKFKKNEDEKRSVLPPLNQLALALLALIKEIRGIRQHQNYAELPSTISKIYEIVGNFETDESRPVLDLLNQQTQAPLLSLKSLLQQITLVRREEKNTPGIQAPLTLDEILTQLTTDIEKTQKLKNRKRKSNDSAAAN